MYAQNDQFEKLETQLRQNDGKNQNQIIEVISQIQAKPLNEWFDILSGSFIVSASQGIKQATSDQVTNAGKKLNEDGIQAITNNLFKQFCEDAGDTKTRIAHYLNDDISLILEKSADVKSWKEYENLKNKDLLLSHLLYIWYLGWQRGYAFTAESNMETAKRQNNDPRLANTSDEQIQQACIKIAATESVKVLGELFHDHDTQERVYLMILAYLQTGRQR
ncbi:hypothetical protein ABTQ33_05445 [Paucilactobacillus suebicus]|uniref:Uncharacterized protein n=1 Tax=Paucilactobacillus suebicus DSM 5007 = KCTC 3549 TaxID=1423807 RepID=A0A0R1W5R2_9LACO|nr:hypothetical protein [Paucilactobacillus suebicus]KRM12834.1 hypothetical protein FD16_GL002013 [Paucilactobacillus suebicus DSM 5007 = KCTC 3549]